MKPVDRKNGIVYTNAITLELPGMNLAAMSFTRAFFRSAFPTSPMVPAGKPYSGAPVTTNSVQSLMNNAPMPVTFWAALRRSFCQWHMRRLRLGYSQRETTHDLEAPQTVVRHSDLWMIPKVG